MKRLLTPIGIALLAGTFATVGLAWAGRPSSPPPKPAQASGPPPAWVESQARSGWLDFGTYCWTTGCADYIPPATRPGLRTFETRVGETLRIHLGFLPRTASVRVLPAQRFTKVPPRRTVEWRVKQLGILELQARGAGGGASYVVDLRR